MPKLSFFPLGNADCTRIDLDDGRKILFDYADRRDPDDEEDLRCDLPKELRDDLEQQNRDYFDVVAFTHLDKDHYEKASGFFYLEHAEKYQDEERIKIRELWVPASVITESGVDDAEGRIIQREARYRLKQGKGIRVFSRPLRLEAWLEQQNLRLEDRKHLITDAGKLIPDFSKSGAEHVEFFVHSPFAKRLDDGTVEDRNDDALVVQATFLCDGREPKVILAADVTYDVVVDFVGITKSHNNDSRLEWDVFKLPHHCSYRSLGPEKGEDLTAPVGEVAWLFEQQGQQKGIVVSTSRPIPEKGTSEDKDDNPPHRQAADYYRSVANSRDGEFKVTMEHPTKEAPQPLVIQVDGFGAAVEKRGPSRVVTVLTQSSPRAG
jgi:hypothetical protein